MKLWIRIHQTVLWREGERTDPASLKVEEDKGPCRSSEMTRFSGHGRHSIRGLSYDTIEAEAESEAEAEAEAEADSRRWK